MVKRLVERKGKIGMDCCKVELVFKEIGGIQVKILEAVCIICSTCYRMKRSNNNAYQYRESQEDYVCTECGSEIMVGKAAPSIHDGPFPLSGSGKVENEEVPYCPKCEKKPNFHGSFITR